MFVLSRTSPVPQRKDIDDFPEPRSSRRARLPAQKRRPLDRAFLLDLKSKLDALSLQLDTLLEAADK